MATSDGLTGSANTEGVERHFRMVNGLGVFELAGNLTLTVGHANILKIDAGGSGRDVTLPAVLTSEGCWFEITNNSSGAEDLTVKNAGGDTIVTISQNEKARVQCDGAAWYHLGIVTVAAS